MTDVLTVLGDKLGRGRVRVQSARRLGLVELGRDESSELLVRCEKRHVGSRVVVDGLGEMMSSSWERGRKSKLTFLA